MLNEAELQELMDDKQLGAVKVPIFYDVPEGETGEGALQKGLDKLCAAADEAVKSGAQLIVLSDASEKLVRTRLAVAPLRCAPLHRESPIPALQVLGSLLAQDGSLRQLCWRREDPPPRVFLPAKGRICMSSWMSSQNLCLSAVCQRPRMGRGSIGL